MKVTEIYVFDPVPLGEVGRVEVQLGLIYKGYFGYTNECCLLYLSSDITPSFINSFHVLYYMVGLTSCLLVCLPDLAILLDWTGPFSSLDIR